MAKGEDKENLNKTSNSNINNNLIHQNIRRNYSNHKNNHNYYNINNNNNTKCNNLANNTLTFNNKTLKTIITNNKSKEEDTNDIINDHVDVNVNEDDGDDDDHVEINNLYTTSLNLMSVFNTTTTTASKGIPVFDDLNYQPQHRYIDRNKLMKLVMDGLGLKKAPNMQTVNISQEEYVTKYREYLQRVHMRKRRELREVLGEYDENILRPLEIFSIVSSGTFKSHNEFSLFRQKRNIDKEEDDRSYDNTDDYYNNKNQTLEERVKNILLLKKKYQKPRSTMKEREERKTNIRLMFALKEEILNLTSSDIEEANIRLVLIHSPILAIRNSKNKKTHTKPKNNSCTSSKKEGKKPLHQVNALNLKLYFISKSGKRVWLDGRKVDINVDLTKPDETHTQWLQFDVSKAVKTAVDNKRQQHVVLELICDNCKRVGARILNDAYNSAADALADKAEAEGHQLMPILNIIGHFDQSHRMMRPHKYDYSEHHEEATTQRHYHHHQTYKNNNNNKNRHNNRRTNCYKANQRCCRHSMEVTFKEIKGFEFIIQPKVFDAGYCHGRCPPRYNPAHHHALLQSLIWKQNHHKAPRPCCAPSKLVELEVLHVDEKDSEKLKISTWSDMKVVECACS
ncbi:TGF-beta domain-containing family member maverick isoform 2-T2 [Cochliomyia hominivorax]